MIVKLLLGITGIASGSGARKDPCTRLNSLSYTEGENCYGLFWDGQRGTGRVCYFSEDDTDDEDSDVSCPRKEPVTPVEAEVLIERLYSLVRSSKDSTRPSPIPVSIERDITPRHTKDTNNDAHTLPDMNLNVEKFGIVALGDVGHQGTALESTTMAVQTKFASTASTGFLLGDNFYPIGVSSPTDAKFEHIFEGLIAQSLPGIPFHVVLGNHDWMGNVDAQIQFSSLNNQWIMPSRFYRRRFVTRSAITCVWFLDTEKVRRREAQDQLSWLESTLSTDSSCSWRIVVGHHPVFDSGFYSDDIRMLLDVLPIMERYGVDMYISGHEHQSRVYRKTDGRKPITFLIAGAASEAVSGYAKPHKNLVWANTEAVSFLHLSISGSEISYAFINSQGLNKPLHADSTSSNSAST